MPTPAQPERAFDYIGLGELLSALRWPSSRRPAEVIDDVRNLRLILGRFAFDRIERRLREFEETVAEELEQHPEKFKSDYPYTGAESIPKKLLLSLNEIVQLLAETILQNWSSREVLPIDRSAVSDMLRALEGTLREDHQKVILSDTIRCLECGAYRAAIVMGWNLAYEHLRQWIFKRKRSRLKQFNAVLVTRNRGPNEPYPPVTVYEDFFEIGERVVIDVAYKAKLFNKQTHQVLVHALTDRNHFAHPSFRRATAVSAAGYIENLILSVVTDPHFA
jgi:hypothetical protein